MTGVSEASCELTIDGRPLTAWCARVDDHLFSLLCLPEQATDTPL